MMTYVFWTCANIEEAQKIATILLNKKLIACASFFPNTLSIYKWKGNIEQSCETKVILKTFPEKFDEVCKEIKQRASYKVSEIAQLSVDRVNPQYFSWMKEELN